MSSINVTLLLYRLEGRKRIKINSKTYFRISIACLQTIIRNRETFPIAIRSLTPNILRLLLTCLRDGIIIYSVAHRPVGNPDTFPVGSALYAKDFLLTIF